MNFDDINILTTILVTSLGTILFTFIFSLIAGVVLLMAAAVLAAIAVCMPFILLNDIRLLIKGLWRKWSARSSEERKD